MTDTIYERVLEARRLAGKGDTQMEIASDLGINQSAVSAWKRGSVPKLRHALEIAYAAGVSLDWLYTGNEPKMAVTGQMSDLWRTLGKLSPEDRAEVLRFALFRAGPQQHK